MPARLARRLVAISLLGGVAMDVLFDRVGLGINAPIAIAAILAAAAMLRPADARIDPLDLWLPVVAMTAAAVVALRHDPVVTYLDLGLGGVATLASVVALAGVAVTRRGAIIATGLGVIAGTWLGIGSVRVLAAAGSDGALGEARTASRRSVPIVRGLLVAAPILIVFTALLSSADVVFGRAVDKALTLPIDAEDLVTRTVLSLAAAWVLGGLFAIAAAVLPVKAEALGLDELMIAVRSTGSRLSAATEASVVLIAVDLLFAVFVAFQLAYLFGGADTVAAAGITYSNYARDGYFQLVAVVVGAGLLLAVAVLAAPGPAGRSRTFLGAALGLLALTAVILASAAVRLALYQQIYGWTELRFYVAASIAWLAICGIVATSLLLLDRMAWLVHGLAIEAVAVTLAISALGPQSFITQQNLARALDPSLVPAEGHSGFDAEYLGALGDDAVPLVIDALPRLDPASQVALRPALEARRTELRQDAGGAAWQAWNLSRERARVALETLR
ncbi:MAG TPA: DUF4173 domain-containing protein [Candidatus Limnocylindrales bacterium]|nr:DUF4173 domain-containing protein [Candidatus Limnocylindrales bacterium]